MEQNPYAAPGSDVSVDADREYEPGIFAMSGRIGRIRYLAYSTIYNFITFAVVGILAAILIPMMVASSDGGADPAMAFLALIIYVPVIAVFFIVVRRRLHDLDKSGWWSLLLLVPIANLLMALYLLFWPGTIGVNRFGPPPVKNGWPIIIFGIVLPLVLFGGMALTSISAYQDYVERAQSQSYPSD